MNRKEFLTHGLIAFGREMIQAASGNAPPSGETGDIEEHGILLIDNRRCLAQRGGCFACMDHCPPEAITIRLGVGISVDPETCNGCGQCIEHCPVEPRVIAMKSQGTT